MQNVEFKSELRLPDAACRQCEVLGATLKGLLTQTDTYYKLNDGRLKRRVTKGAPAEWIFYHRVNDVAPRLSNYAILGDDEASRRWGTADLKPWVVVSKMRELWMYENVRIHLDDVDDIGYFIEFEAVVVDDCDRAACEGKVARLRQAFAPVLGEPVSVSYCDLAAVDQA